VEDPPKQKGAPLSRFERDALVERHCELFGSWPDDSLGAHGRIPAAMRRRRHLAWSSCRVAQSIREIVLYRLLQGMFGAGLTSAQASR